MNIEENDMSLDHSTLAETAAVAIHPTGCMSKAQAIALARSCGAVVWEGRARVEKFNSGETTPYEVIDSEPNLMLTAGAGLLWTLATGAGGTALNSANARLCVGDSATAATAGQADLLGANKFRKLVSATPSLSTNQAQFVTTFVEAEANFTWNEAGVANSAAGATLLNRFVQSFGTKTSAAQWTLTVTLSLA